MRPFLFIALWLGLVALIAGCRCSQVCYENMGIVDHEQGIMLIFNKCNGDMYLDILPGKGGKPEGQTPDQNIPRLPSGGEVES